MLDDLAKSRDRDHDHRTLRLGLPAAGAHASMPALPSAPAPTASATAGIPGAIGDMLERVIASGPAQLSEPRPRHQAHHRCGDHTAAPRSWGRRITALTPADRRSHAGRWRDAGRGRGLLPAAAPGHEARPVVGTRWRSPLRGNLKRDRPSPDTIDASVGAAHFAGPVLDIRNLVVEFPTRRGVLTAIQRHRSLDRARRDPGGRR